MGRSSSVGSIDGSENAVPKAALVAAWVVDDRGPAVLRVDQRRPAHAVVLEPAARLLAFDEGGPRLVHRPALVVAPNVVQLGAVDRPALARVALPRQDVVET